MGTALIIGAAITESPILATSNVDMITVLFGAITSMIVGYASLKLLLKMVMKEKLHLFSYYCWAVGLLAILSYLFQAR